MTSEKPNPLGSKKSMPQKGALVSYYGVKCKTCGTPIAFGRVKPEERNEITFYAPPLAPVACKACGSSYQYGSHDVFEFEADGDIQLFEQG